MPRTLGPQVWNRRVARLPAHGVLLLSTDLQGNLRDYEAMKRLYEAEEAAGNDPVLAFCGDMVHGPSPDLHAPGRWPTHLGTEYRDQSTTILVDFEAWSQDHRTFSLLGNHEHAHCGGPIVPKFYPDEAAVLNAALGSDRDRMCAFMATFPLLAVGPGGVVLTHACPAATEATLADFEALSYDGYSGDLPTAALQRHRGSTLMALLWSRSARATQAQALLAACAEATSDGQPAAFVVFGHDVVWDGYEKVGAEQICVSTSFGCLDRYKTYLRLDLARRYRSVQDLREGEEIRRLYR